MFTGLRHGVDFGSRSLIALVGLAMVIAIAGCGGDGTSDTTLESEEGVTTAGSTESTGTVESLSWRIHGDQTPGFWWSEYLADATAELNDLTAGRIEAEFYPQSSLGIAPGDILDPVANGEVEVAEFVGSYVGGEAPYLTVLGLPMLSGGVENARVLMDEMRPDLEAQLSEDYGLRILATLVSTPLQLYIGENSFDGIESLEGLRIRTLGPDQEAFIEALGATPITVGIEELPQGLATGQVDGAISGTQYFLVQEFSQYGPTLVAWDAFTTPGYLVIGESTWDGLDSELQTTLSEWGIEFEDAIWTRAATLEEEQQQEAEESGFEVVAPDAETAATFQERAVVSWDLWAENADALGRELLEGARP